MDENNNKQVVRKTGVQANINVQAPLMEQEKELDINAVRLQIEEDEAFEKADAFADKNKNAKLKVLLENVPVDMPESYIESAGFATTFNTQLGSWKRLFKSDLRGSRLREKAENATKLKESSHDYDKAYRDKLNTARKTLRKLLREQSHNKKYQLTEQREADIALMMNFMQTGKRTVDKDMMRMYLAYPRDAFALCMQKFIEIDISSLKLNSDKDFVRSTKKIRELTDQVTAIKTIIRKYPDIAADQGPEFLEKVEHTERLIGYCEARRNLLLNNFYITHYNDEMTYLSKKDLREEPDEENDDRSKPMKKLDKGDNARQNVSNLIYAVEMSSFFFRHGYNTEDPDARQEFERLYSRKLTEKQKLSTMDSFVRHSKSIEGAGGTRYGWTLQFFNWIFRDKRRTDYGEAMYDESVKKLERLPQVIRNHKEMNALIKEHGVAPDIHLEAYIYDSVKDGMRQEFERAPEPGNDPDYKLAYEALKNWTTVKGIVNQDTARMEMAFSDRFIKASKRWLAAHPGADESDDAYLAEKCKFLKRVNETVSVQLNGRLNIELKAEDLNKLKETLPILKEDNTYLKNVEESNVKDIPLFLHSPNINDIKQAAVGDCWLHSGIQSLVASDPHELQRMFLDLGDGSVIVRLFQLRDKTTGEASSDYTFAANNQERFKFSPVYIRLSKDYEEGNGYANDCLWVQLLERAVAASGLNGQKVVKIKNNKVQNTTSELTCGSPEAAMSMLTGKFWMMTDKEKKFEPPKVSTDQEYAFILAGLPVKMKDEITTRIEDLRAENPDVVVNEETLLGFVREAKQSYINSCDEVLQEYSEIKTLYSNFVKANNMQDMPDIGPAEALLKDAMWYPFVSGDMEKKVKDNLREIEKGAKAKITTKDSYNFEPVIYQIRSKGVEIKKIIEGGDAEKIRSAITDYVFFANDARNAVELTGDALKANIDDTLKGITSAKADMDDVITATKITEMKTRYNVSGYKPAKLMALIKLRDAINNSGGSVPAAFGSHCMTVLETKYENGRWFVLIRDPFNIYNRKYTEKRGRLSCNSTGFGSVFRPEYNDKKRHLTDAGEGSNFRSGFRGLSWWTFDDFYKEYDFIAERG